MRRFMKFASVGADIRPAHVVHEEEQEVGLLGCCNIQPTTYNRKKNRNTNEGLHPGTLPVLLPAGNDYRAFGFKSCDLAFVLSSQFVGTGCYVIACHKDGESKYAGGRAQDMLLVQFLFFVIAR